MESWDDMTLVHRNERVVIDGIGFAAIGRLKLLQLLQQRLRSVGVTPEFSRAVTSLDEFDGADLVVGADGVNSLVRRTLRGRIRRQRHVISPITSPGSAPASATTR